GTILFGGDRFGPNQDYASTYRALGGSRLATDVVQTIIQTCFDTLEVIYNDPTRSDSFPQVVDTLRALPAARGVPPADLALLERVIAQHELGRVPDDYAVSLQKLARSHVLGVIANLLSRKDPWLQEFYRAGVLDLFAVTVFSSDGSSVKPSRKLFDKAISALGVPRSDVVFVGDNLRCDIGGAAGAGLATVWIDRHGRGRAGHQPSRPGSSHRHHRGGHHRPRDSVLCGAAVCCRIIVTHRGVPRPPLSNKRLKLAGGDRFKGNGVSVPWRARTDVHYSCAGERVARSLSAIR